MEDSLDAGAPEREAPSRRARLGIAAVALVLALATAPEARATPLYSVIAGTRCDSCHIEPVGWLEPAELIDRHRTVSCNACHVSPTGGGQRTGFGRYFGREVLPTVALEPRPSRFVDPDKYMNTSDLPVRQIADRLGDIDPEPRYSAGLDARLMLYGAIGERAAVFPMQLDFHGYGRLREDWSIYGTLGLQGRRQRTIERPTENTAWRELFTLRELVAQRDLPYNGYVRGGRFSKPYGWRTPDHTVSTRQPLDQDQYAQVFGIEGGINPEFPYANLALFYQGWKDFPGERSQAGAGASATAGYRDFEWQVGMSAEYLTLFDAAAQVTVGPMVGRSFEQLAYIGQADVRFHLQEEAAPASRGFYTYHELDWMPYPGVTGLAGFGWYRTQVSRSATQRTRITLGGQWEMVTHVQLAVQYRVNLKPLAPLGHEVLTWLHLWL